MSFLDPQGDKPVTFEQMEKAILKFVNKEKDCPKKTKKSSALAAFEVYHDRIFVYSFDHGFFPKKKTAIAGAVSRPGIMVLYQDRTKKYYHWDDINSIEVQYIEVKDEQFPSNNGTYALIYFGLVTGGRMHIDAHQITMLPRGSYIYYVEIFAMYYARVRQERLQMRLQRGPKQVLLHGEYDVAYAQEVLRRFHSPEGMVLKKFRKRMHLSPAGIRVTRGKRTVLAEYGWQEVRDVIFARDASKGFSVIVLPDGYKPKVMGWRLEEWKPIPAMPVKMETQRMHILPVCWLEMP